MYSIDIKGLSQYRTQTNLSAGGSEVDQQISNNAASYARLRLLELIDVYETNARVGGSDSTSFSATEDKMKEYIYQTDVSSGYKSAVATTQKQQELMAMSAEEEAKFYRDQLWADYQLTLKTFKEELESDYKAAKESYDLTTAPYSDWKKELSNDLFKFFLYEGYITPEYLDVQGKKDKTKIVKFSGGDIASRYKTAEEAIERVYSDKITSELNQILSFWGTAGTLATRYAADSTDIQLHNNMKDGSLVYPNIEGIVSLGHTTETTSVVVNGVTYAVAQDENLDENGKPKNSNEY
jgi:hypothetical protein